MITPSTTGPIRHRFLAVLDFLLRYGVQVYSVGVSPMSVTVLLDERGGTEATAAAIRAHLALTDAGTEPPQATARPHKDIDGGDAAILAVTGVLPEVGDISLSTQLDTETTELVAQAAGHPELPRTTETPIDLGCLRVAAGLTALARDAQRAIPEPRTAEATAETADAEQ